MNKENKMFDKKVEFVEEGNFVLIMVVDNNKKEIFRVPKSAFTSAVDEYRNKPRG